MSTRQVDPRIAIGEAVFAAWSSGDADAPARYFHPDAVLHDVVSGTFVGWPAIRAFFSRGLAKWDDLRLEPDQWWTNSDAIAVHYVMHATVTDPAMFGPEVVGRCWEVEAMSWLRIEGGLVVYEADFHDSGSRRQSLGLEN